MKAVARDAFSPVEVTSAFIAREMVKTILRGLKDTELVQYGFLLDLQDLVKLLMRLLEYSENTQVPHLTKASICRL